MQPPKIPDPNNAGQLIEQEAFHIKSKSIMRLKVTSIAAMSSPMPWTHRLKNFQLQWSALTEAKDEEVELPSVNSLQVIVK